MASTKRASSAAVPDSPDGGAVIAEEPLGFALDAAKFVHVRPDAV
jgi:hypothetical protein